MLFGTAEEEAQQLSEMIWRLVEAKPLLRFKLVQRFMEELEINYREKRHVPLQKIQRELDHLFKWEDTES